MNKKPPVMETSPPTTTEVLLRNKFDESIVDQAQRLDELAKLLITIELAMLGLYATALKLLGGMTATAVVGPAVYGTFIFWGLALLFTLRALLPRRYNVDRDIVRRTPPNEFAEPLSLEAFFKCSAQYKYRFIVISCICFFSGVCLTLYSIL